MTQFPGGPPEWSAAGGGGVPPTGGQPWQPAGATGWQPPGSQPPGYPAPGLAPPGAPLWQPAGPPPKRSRAGLWWALGAGALVVAVAVTLVVLLNRPLDPPREVTAAVTEDGVLITWQSVRDAAGYELFRDGDSVGTTEETSFVDGDAPGGTEFRYSVAALDGDGDGSDPAAAAAVVLTPVDPPEEIYVVSSGPDVRVEWSAVTGADRYEVTRNGQVLVDDVTDTTYLDPGVPQGDHVYEITAVDEDGEGSRAVGPAATVTAAGPWRDAARIGATFDQLVGAAPGDSAWNGATCELETAPGAQAVVLCDYPDGIQIAVIEFSSTVERDARIAELAALGGEGPGDWSYSSGSPAQGQVYLSPAEADPTWRLVTFTRSGDELFCIYAEWPGHTQDELRETWFVGAPF